MAKVKNKKKTGLADKVHAKNRERINKKKLNPFEVHINKEKLKVLGKKSKHDRGLPGVSRAKAIQKRKETLGTEMKLMNKTNLFIDRRIGEKNSQLSAEERMVARFAAERAKQHSRKSVYNLADDEVLTHRGQTLEQIEKFDDPRSSDDEDEENKFGGLDGDFVSEGHFGGGMLSKSDTNDGAKSHKDLIEKLIAESKKRKAEKQKEKEQTLNLTEKLDSEWKDLQPVVFKRQKVEDQSVIDKLLASAEKGQDYDKMMRELRFEKRGTPSEGLKNTEKQQEEERKMLEELEKQRQQRMMPEDDVVRVVQPTNKHRSADDLDDNFDLDNDQEFMLAYDKDGKPLVPDHIMKDYSVPQANKQFEKEISDTSDDSDDDDEDEVEGEGEDSEDAESGEDSVTNEGEIIITEKVLHNRDDDASEDNHSETSDIYKEGSKSDNINEHRGIQNGIRSSDDDNKDVGVSDNKKKNSNNNIKGNTVIATITENENENNSDEGDSNEIVNVNERKPIINGIVNKLTAVVKNADTDSSDSENQCSDSESDDDAVDKFGVKDDFKDFRGSEVESDIGEEISGEIKSFFDLKTEEGDNLRKLLEGKSPSQQSTALLKLIKSYDPSLSQNNKDLLSRLFAHLLQYINDIFSNLNEDADVLKPFLIFDKLVPHFYDLVHTNKVSTKKFLSELLKEKHDNFKRRRKVVPNLDTIIFFKLISLLYPTSDFRHPVTTPSLIFMSEILSLCKFTDRPSISRGLLITALILEYTALSKRFVPAAINFLRGILYLCANTSILNPIKVVPPFRRHRDTKILNIEIDCSKMKVGNKMAAKDLVLQDIDDDFKIRVLLSSSIMIKEFFDNYNDIDAQAAIFEPHIKLLGRVDLDLYPKKTSDKVYEVLKHMKQCLEVKTYTPLAREKARPKALRLYEPDIQEVFTGSKNAKLSKEGAERARLQGKYKKEMKGALREIRRDKAYIASVKIKEKIRSDNIRKEKVKQIYKEASIQQGELNKLSRTK